MRADGAADALRIRALLGLGAPHRPPTERSAVPRSRLRRTENSSQRPPTGSPASWRVTTVNMRAANDPTPSATQCRNIDLLPFRSLRRTPREGKGAFAQQALALILGPTYPYTTAVDKETFSTLAFNRSQLNIRYYHQDLHRWMLHRGAHPCFTAPR